MKSTMPVLALLLVADIAHAQTPMADLSAGGHRIVAEVAADEPIQRLGLMYRSKLPPDQGMVFVYPYPIKICMWMKNTLIPLSVAFLDENARILNIADMAPQSEQSHCASGPARFALEMNQGWFAAHGVKPGDKIEGMGGL